MALNATSLRIYMVLTGITEIVDQKFTDAISDATTINVTVTTDEVALKFYSAYLLAKSINWKELKKTGDKEFFEPNPDTYMELYNLRIDSIAVEDSTDDVILGSVVNSDPKYNDDTGW